MANTLRHLVLLAGAAAFGATLCASAADESPKPELVSGASAQMLAETCAGCHGTDGLSAGPASPIIAAMNAEYFVELMQAFREGTAYSTIMGRIAKGYSDEEIEAMAGYFAAKPFKAADQEFDAKLAKKGAKLHDKFCEKCHSEGGKVLVPGAETAAAEEKPKGKAKDEEGEEGEDEESNEEYQILAGQWTPWLQYAMADFREERREMPKKMKSKLKDLLAKEGDAGLKALYAFYASQK